MMLFARRMQAMPGVLFHFLHQYLLYLLSPFAWFVFSFSLELFHVMLLWQNSCHKAHQPWHVCMWAMGGGRWKQSSLILEENCHFRIQNLHLKRILTLKFLLIPVLIHWRSTVEGQKKAQCTQTFTGTFTVTYICPEACFLSSMKTSISEGWLSTYIK